MGRFLSHIPGFRTGNPRHMVLAGVYYLFSLSMMLASVALGLLLLCGPFLVFNGHAAIEKYNESKNAKALTALFLSAAICGGSLIGFVMDMTGRQGDTPAKMAALVDTTPYPTPYTTPVAAVVILQTPETSLPPSPAGLLLGKAVVLGYTADGIHMQYADESAGDIRLAGIDLDESTDAAGYMEDTLPPGSIVYLERDRSGADCYVWMEEPLSLDPGEFREKTLNALLVANGYALASGNPAGQYTDVLTACQEDAQAAFLGLWAVAAATASIIPDVTPAPTPAPTPSQETEQAPAPAPEEPPAEAPPGGVYYCGSKNSDVFHLSTCGSAGQISPENLVIYSSREDAIRRGKRPCKKCNP